FGDEQTFEAFMQRVAAEGDLSKLQSVVGGSATARRLQAAGFDPHEIGPDLLAHAAHGPHGLMSLATRLAAKAGQGALTRNTAREMGPLLMTQSAPSLEALLANWGKNAPGLPRWTYNALPVAGARGASSLFDY